MIKHVLIVLACAGCAELPRTPPPLAGMSEPVELLHEPDDEAQRDELPAGSFTGLVVGDARTSLDAMLGEPPGVVVTSVVENSPGAAAGIVEGDLLVEVSGRNTLALHWPSEWRQAELEAEPGSVLHVIFDRAGAELEADITVEARIQPAGREGVQRLREDQRVGVVVRTATEVEARAAALGPGGGAVVVGLTLESPWRSAGVVFGDLIRAVDGVEVAHPQVLLERIRAAPEGASLELEIVRQGAIVSLSAPVSRREQELKSIRIPLVFTYERERDQKELWVLLGVLRWRSTPAAWDVRLLWLVSFGGGDADRLERVER